MMERDRQSLYMNMQSPNKYSSYVSAPRGMLGGPSMDTASLYQLLAQQIAGSSPAMGGIGAAGGMGTAESALSGPGGLAMALPMKYLSGMHNQAQEAINAFTGMPNPVRKDPMRQIGAFLDQFTNKPVLSPGAIGTQNNISSVGGGGLIGTVGAMQALGSGNPGLQAALMGAMFPGAGAEPFEQEKPDEDQRGGPSDNDADNPPSEARSAARSAVERMVAASPMASARPVGGFQFGGTGVLAEKLRNSSVYQPPDRSMSELMREPDQYRPSSVPAPLPRLPRHAARHELMGSRPEPVVNDYQLGDYNAPQQRRPRGYGVGGGF